MRYWVFDDMSQCTEVEVARLLPLVSNQRREQALRYHHTFGRYCCLKSYEMLMTLLGQYADGPQDTQEADNHPSKQLLDRYTDGRCVMDCGVDNAHRNHRYGVEFVYNEYGQPSIPGGPCFSISHCKNGIAVAIDDRPVGIDIESIRSAKPALVQKTMNTAEQALIAQSGSAGQGLIAQSGSDEQALITQFDAADRAFTRLWTKKEAVLKLRGTGIISDLHDTLTDIDNLSFHVEETERYIVTIATTTSLR